MSYQEMLFTFLGGLGIFLFGIKYLGDGLQKAAGNRLREILNRFTSTPFRAVLAGIIVTGLIQSSSGTTVLAVGLVSAGFMTLKQAIGVIMGANVGTTVTAFIIGFNLSEYALPIIGTGAILLFFAKRSSLQSIGQILFGFGALFYGLKLMGGAMDPLKDLPQFNELMIRVSHHPVLGVGIGTLLTMVLQSSSATIGILQQLYMQGSVTLTAALPILFGDNIGTTITAIIACLGASIAAKRTAASHVIFNLVGAIIFTLLLGPFTQLVTLFAQSLGLNPAMQIAFAHGLFNISNLAIQFWFIAQIEFLVKKIVPGSEKNLNIRPVTLSEAVIHTSSVMAIEQAKGEIIQMGNYVLSSLKGARKYYHDNKEEWHDDVLQYEEAINQCDVELTEYLVKISTAELSPLESQEQAMLLEFTKDFERIGDHSMNIIRYVEESIALEEKQRAKDKKNKAKTTSSRQTFLLQDEDLEKLFDKVLKNIYNALQVLENDDMALAQKMLYREEEINQLVELLRKKYIRLMTKGEGRAADGVLLIDISSNLERSSDRTLHIAKYFLGNKYNFKYDTTNFQYEEAETLPLTNIVDVKN
ncbi:Na/Pi cotransporter family protein [Enterococcus dongliensis]|uniref:Na/Pi cotransporter family protein n=1 Tax=Enterococcus dongliensis TaxID=2559925 RepID=A0AAW8TPT6_9ENTE|nr:Na/Pi cotransporter family protein [Enterococcus dongliensis]MDT2597781.1 Na/Pi cotransporter family protein [Enterococcus dongliensis]MDT2634920.1 Na/Pi cotransporter family protein [Enterococcus dongliensis]MDT2638065.1 Na/Pi cotransporter family protein [Enterococcus dongliensis]MDT2638622.1 Na/Pi cotransporter family protein [Enterococcus dongliensis]MDT2645743.1 Na/Pi cotransporter family protein [Enterococcus dongliensis]